MRLKPWQKDTGMKRIWILLKGIKSDVGVHLLWGKASCHWCTWDSRRWRCGSLQMSPWPAPPTTTWSQRCRCTSSSSAGAGRRCRPSSGRRWPGLRAPALHEADKGPGGTTWCWSWSCLVWHLVMYLLSGSGKMMLTCIMDLSEYISSMVLWIRVMLPWRSGGEKSTHKSFSQYGSNCLLLHPETREFFWCFFFHRYLIYFWANQLYSEVWCNSVLSVIQAYELCVHGFVKHCSFFGPL